MFLNNQGDHKMFMFRKRNVEVSTSKGLQKEAQKFQEAVADINANFRPSQIDVSIIDETSKKFGVDVDVIASAFEVFLKNNALVEIRKVKSVGDFTVVQLEQIANKYGFELDDLGVDYYSVD